MAERMKLPVWRTVIAAPRLLAESWKSTLVILTPVLAGLVILDIALADFWSRHPAEPDSSFPAEAVIVALNLDTFLLFALSAVAIMLWQRHRVFGSGAMTMAAISADWQYLVAMALHWGALLAIFLGLKLIAGMPLGLWATGLASQFLAPLGALNVGALFFSTLLKLLVDGMPLLVALYVSGRLGIVIWALPGATPGALEHAWNAGRGNGWRIALTLYLAVIPFALLQFVLRSAPDQMDFRLTFLLWTDVFGLLQVIVGAAVIAAAHASLVAREEPDDG